MNELSRHIGSRIRQYRKLQRLTLQQMADHLQKSKATMSKYESGDIILDVEVLYAIANLLQISINQLTDYNPDREPQVKENPAQTAEKVSSNETSALPSENSHQSPFFHADQLYFYYYDGRYRRLKEGFIRIHHGQSVCREDGIRTCPATATISYGTPMGRNHEESYVGNVSYSDMLIRFTFASQQSFLEDCQLYLFNPSETAQTDLFTEGLLSGIASQEQVPYACKCLISLTPQNTELTGPLLSRLVFTKRELQLLQKRNMLLSDNSQL